MDLGLKGKVAISGGGSKGIGRAVSDDLGREGARVVVAARGREAVDETVEAIRAAGGEAVPAYVDMATKPGIEEAIAIARQHYGDPEVVIGNVYGPTHGRWDETADGDFLEAYESIVMSQVYLLRAVTPAMRERGWGRIVLVNSISAKQPHREMPLITANVTRVGALSLNKSVSDELAQFGITINTIGTGGFSTGRWWSYMQAKAEKEGVPFDFEAASKNKETPVGRLGTPEEMSAVIVFLCSTRASYVTGQFIVVDGGAVKGLY